MIPETQAEIQLKHEKRRRRFLCNYIGIALGLLIAAPVGVLFLDRREPIVLLDGRIDPPVVQPAQKVSVTWEVEVHRDCGGDFSRKVVDASGKIHEFQREPTIYYIVKPHKKFVKEFTMPDGIIEGPAYYQVKGSRWCNILQHYIWPIPFQSPRIPFYVVSPPKPDVPPSIIEDKMQQLKEQGIK